MNASANVSYHTVIISTLLLERAFHVRGFTSRKVGVRTTERPRETWARWVASGAACAFSAGGPLLTIYSTEQHGAADDSSSKG